MFNIPIEKIISEIGKKTGLSEEEINKRIEEKIKQLSDLVSREGAAHIIANELGIKLVDFTQSIKIRDLKPGFRSVDVVGKVIKTFELREFQRDNKIGKVSSLLIADETGTIRVTLWHSHAELVSSLKEGDVVKVKGAYIKDNKGRREIHLGERSALVINPEGETVELMAKSNALRKQISELQENDQNVEILATIVHVFDIRFFEVCPFCFKRVRMSNDVFVCGNHNIVEPKISYVLNLVADDGTSTINVVCYKSQIERLLSKSSDEIVAYRHDLAFMEFVRKSLLGKTVRFSGRTQKNLMFDKVEFIAQLVLDVDFDSEIKKIEEDIVT